MTAGQIAAALAEIARLGELAGENPFRTRAFAAAARTLDTSDADLTELVARGSLTDLHGVGPGIAEAIAEMVQTGRSAVLEDMRAKTPPGLYDVLRIPGLGTKKVHQLHASLGIDSLDALEAAAREGKLAQISGFGAKTQARILEGVGFVRASRRRRRIDVGTSAAVDLAQALRGLPYVSEVEIAGEVRRCMESVGAIELIVATAHPAGSLVRIASRLDAERVDGEPAVRRELADGLPMIIRAVVPERFGAALVWATGSERHRAVLEKRAAERGLVLDADALVRGGGPLATPDEEAVYAALGLPWIPPAIREGTGEVEAAEAGHLPGLLALDHLRGTFHCHTAYSDGTATVAEMAEGARARGWRYLGLADHSRSAGYAGGLSPAAVRKQQAEIDAWNRAHGGSLRLFKGTESDILPDGSLDYDDALLGSFDYVVGSVHSSFGMGQKEMTDRIVRAVRNPYLSILGHATGRLLLARDAYRVDVHAVIAAAAESGVAVEINADPHRLDLDWRHLRYATDRGVPIAINPDAHSVAGLDNVRWGVGVGQKGWLTPEQTVNAWPLERVEDYLAERKSRRPA